MSYTTRERPYRTRQRMREEPPKDTIAAAVTTQTIICILLIVSMFLIKKTDTEQFFAIKEQYGVMISDASQSEQMTGWLLDEGGVLDKAKQYASLLIPEKLKGFITGGDTLDTAEPEGEEWEEYANVPEEDAQQKTAHAQYDYLNKRDVQYILSGGEASATDDDITDEDIPVFMPAPAGTNFSPVYLSKRIIPPVTGVITSLFSHREHPLTGKDDFHTGIDIAAEKGTPILTALPGEVEEIGESDIYGNYIVIKHATNLKTSYSHCSEILAQEGAAVEQGEQIALVGDTGVATGPHLHFSVIIEDEFADPSWLLNDYIQLVE